MAFFMANLNLYIVIKSDFLTMPMGFLKRVMIT